MVTVAVDLERICSLASKRWKPPGAAFFPKDDPQKLKKLLKGAERYYGKGKLPPEFDSLVDRVLKESGKHRGSIQDFLKKVLGWAKNPDLLWPLAYAAAGAILPGGDEQLNDPQVQEQIRSSVEWVWQRYFSR